MIILLRLTKIMRVTKLNKITEKLDDFIINMQFVKIVFSFSKLFFIIITSAHWIACFFHYLV